MSNVKAIDITDGLITILTVINNIVTTEVNNDVIAYARVCWCFIYNWNINMNVSRHCSCMCLPHYHRDKVSCFATVLERHSKLFTRDTQYNRTGNSSIFY